MSNYDGPPKYWHIPPEGRLKVCQRLELETNDLQDKLILDPKRFNLFRGARRVGKSYGITKRHFPMSLCPKSLHWIIGPTYDLAHKEFRYWLDFLLKFQQKMGKKCISKVFDSPSSGQLYIRTTWGAEILGKSAANPQSLLGDALDSALLVEAAQLPREIWERYVRPTLATKEGYATFGSTPDAAGLWLYEMELMIPTMPDLYSFHHMASWDCPHYSTDDIAAAKKELSEDAFYEQYGGEWRFYTGRVYKLFKPDIHLVEPFEIPTTWEIGSGIDFGSRDPMVSEIAAKDPSGNVYFFGEYYEQRQELSTQDHCSQILRTEQKYGIKPNRITRVADHHGLGAQLIIDASRAGMPCIPCASKDRRARRDCAMSAFTVHDNQPHPYHVREFGQPMGDFGSYPKVFIFKGRCPNLIRELQFLRWKETLLREGATNDTEGDNHAIDAMEYRLERWQTGRVARFRRAGNANTGANVMDQTGYYAKHRGPVKGHPWQQARRLS